MELLSILAASRGTTEIRLANDYTVRQLMHMTEAHMKNQTFVLNLVSAALGGKSTAEGAVARSGIAKSREKGTPYPAVLPQWFGKPKAGYRVVSMDESAGKVMTAFGMGRMPGR